LLLFLQEKPIMSNIITLMLSIAVTIGYNLYIFMNSIFYSILLLSVINLFCHRKSILILIYAAGKNVF